MRIALALAALAIPATPGIAAAATDIGCIEGKLGAETAARVGDQIVAMADKGQSLDSALDADRDAVIAARNTCRKAGNWSNDAVDIAMSYFKARAALNGIQRALATDGLVAARLTADYAALPIDDRRSIVGGKAVSAGAMASMLKPAQGMGGDKATRSRTLRHIAILYSALAAIEFYPADFAAA